MVVRLDRYEAESEIAEAADLVRKVIASGVQPVWLWERNRDALVAVLDELDTAALSFASDEP